MGGPDFGVLRIRALLFGVPTSAPGPFAWEALAVGF